MWSIVEVARISGVTARTLRHYDAIGLLKPASTAPNGYREYGEAELRRLQRLLVLRALGLPLAEIGAVLDAERDELTALEGHLLAVRAEAGRLAAIAATLETTIARLRARTEGTTMSASRPENLFEGFDPTEYDEEARRRWPAEHASSKAFTDTLTADDTARMQREFTALLQRMADVRAAGAAPGDPAMQEQVAALYASVARMWTPDAAAFAALGRMYVDDERFRATYERVAPGLAEYVRDAMAVYAEGMR